MKILKKILFCLIAILACKTSDGQTLGDAYDAEIATGTDFFIDGYGYKLTSKDGCVTLTAIEGECPETVIIPSTITYRNRTLTVTGIAPRVFNHKKITSITLPPTVKNFGTEAVASTLITSLKIPNGSNIGDYAFADNKKLKYLEIGEISSSPYYLSILASFRGCDNLEQIRLHNETPPHIDGGNNFPFSDMILNFTELYVPSGTLSAYRSSYYWNMFHTIKEYQTEEQLALQQLKETPQYKALDFFFQCLNNNIFETKGPGIFSTTTWMSFDVNKKRSSGEVIDAELSNKTLSYKLKGSTTEEITFDLLTDYKISDKDTIYAYTTNDCHKILYLCGNTSDSFHAILIIDGKFFRFNKSSTANIFNHQNEWLDTPL